MLEEENGYLKINEKYLYISNEILCEFIQVYDIITNESRCFMSLNNRGFMMAELMITSVVIMISIVSLYTGFNKIYTNYKVRNSYDDSNLLYGTKLIKDFLIDQNKINLLIKNNKDYINISLCNLNFECVGDESTYYNDIKRIYDIIPLTSRSPIL